MNTKSLNRKSIRFKKYDYSEIGAYFVTICTHKQRCVLGTIINGKMQLNKYGTIVKNEWGQTSNIRKNILLDEYIIMPNHIHGIIMITEKLAIPYSRGVLQYAPTNSTLNSPTQTVGSIVRGFKSAITTQINTLQSSHGKPFWQRNYYEHIIGDEDELNEIRAYIYENPLKREFDSENPKKQNGRPTGAPLQKHTSYESIRR